MLLVNSYPNTVTVAPLLYPAAMAVSPKQRKTPVQIKRERPPKCKLFRKKLSRSDEMTVNQLVSHEKEKAAQCHKRKKATCDDDSYENDELKSAVMQRAMEVKANLSPEFPSTVKYMLPSHVAGGFWLGLPKPFCSNYLPKESKVMVLEDEEGREFQTKYLAEKVGLSGGWRGFSIAHKLVEGDACVFQLVNRFKFKVYIVRRKGSSEVDVALGLLKLESSTQQIDLGKEPKICQKNARDKPLENFGMYENRISMEKKGLPLDNSQIDRTLEEVLPLDIAGKSIPKNEPTLYSSNLGPTANQSKNDSLDLGYEDLDRIRLSESIVDFKEVKNFEDFNILVNGLVIDCELSKYLQMKYYELCCNQKSFLHENLLEGLNYKLVAGVISETINIVDAIRASKLTTPRHNFLIWDQTLKSFEGLGMKVDFLRARLDQLMNLSEKSRRYREARLERINANEEKRKLEAKLLEVNRTLNRLDIQIRSLEEENIDKLEILFQELANAPW